ncbi:DLW-39 family protein [Ornithinimicrobium sp. Y1847]
MKRFLFIAAAAAGLAVLKKMQDQQAERDLWAEATDDVTGAHAR